MKIFRKRDTADRIVSAIEKNSQLSRLEKLSIGFSIFSGLISLFFAMWGILLTIKYGDNKEQIGKLTDIALKQEVQNKNSVKMIDELKNQVKLIKGQNDELKSQGKTLSAQSLIISKEFVLVQSERNEAKLRLLKEEKENFHMLLKLNKEIVLLMPYQGSGYFKNYTLIKQKEFYKQFKKILDKGSNSLLVILNDSIRKKWDKIEMETSNNLFLLDIIDSSLDSILLAQSGKDFQIFVDHFYDFEFSFNRFLTDKKLFFDNIKLN